MKKLFLLVVCCLVLFTGCSKKEEKFQASEFKWDKGPYSTYLTGKIKNVSSNSCEWLYIDYTIKNGILTETNGCTEHANLASDETKTIECIYTGNHEENITNFSITIDSIKCVDK